MPTSTDHDCRQTKRFSTKLSLKIPDSDTPIVVYKIDCKNCPSSFIGQSIPHLHKCICI